MTSRRDFLAAALTAAAVGSLGKDAHASGVPQDKTPEVPPGGPTLRVAFLTDTHLRAPDDVDEPDEPDSSTRVLKAFEAVRAAAPHLIVYGGDNVFAVDNDNSLESAKAQFENWRRITTEHAGGIDSLSVIGNHDIWTGNAAASHPKGGKAYALEAFAMPGRYYSRDVFGWRFCMLDTFHDDGCHIDEEQFAWLRERVVSHPGPVCLVHHAPVVTLGQFLEQREPGLHGGYNAPRGWVIGNAADVLRFVADHKNVRLSLCGHMHQVEDLDYLGCRWIDGGAVSGAWWGGAYLEHFPCNFLLLDLKATGEVTMRSLRYENQ